MTPGLPLALTLGHPLSLTPGLPLGLISGLPFGLTPSFLLARTLAIPFALVASPKLGLRQRGFNSKVDRVARVATCYVLHNYYLEWGACELGPPNVVALQNNLQGFGDRLPPIREGEIAKVEEEKLITALFKQWLISNPIQE